MSEHTLSDDERRTLLLLARASIARVLGGRVAEPSLTERLTTEKRGAFITLREGGALRGCIGFIEPIESMAEAVRQLAVKAALEDPRFDPVSLSELEMVTIECSVLSPLQPCKDPSTIRIGTDGVVIEHAWRRGLLLPEVAIEAGWNAAEFVAHTCLKAGLPRNAWKDRGARLFVFQTEHFAESVDVDL